MEIGDGVGKTRPHLTPLPCLRANLFTIAMLNYLQNACLFYPPENCSILMHFLAKYFRVSLVPHIMKNNK